jgi:hypothetical protein
MLGGRLKSPADPMGGRYYYRTAGRTEAPYIGRHLLWKTLPFFTTTLPGYNMITTHDSRHRMIILS